MKQLLLKILKIGGIGIISILLFLFIISSPRGKNLRNKDNLNYYEEKLIKQKPFSTLYYLEYKDTTLYFIYRDGSFYKINLYTGKRII